MLLADTTVNDDDDVMFFLLNFTFITCLLLVFGSHRLEPNIGFTLRCVLAVLA